MGVNVKITERDLGWKQLRALTQELSKHPVVKVGVQSDEPSHTSKDGSINMAELMQIHEFGTETIPERPVFRIAMTENASDLEAYKKELVRRMLPTEGMKTETALGLLGQYMQAKIQSNFGDESKIEPLKDPTRRGKNEDGDGKPLVDTGTLRKAIRYVVDMGGK